MPLPLPFLDKRTLHFLTMYETANIHRASEELHLTQPALTKSLKQLEELLGVRLFERSVKGLKPTEAGQIFYRYASTLRQSAEYMIAEMEAQATGNSGTLRIGAGVGWSTTVIPSMIGRLREQFPSLSLELVTGVADQLASLFQSGKVDMLLVSGPMEPLDAPDYCRIFLMNVPMVAVADESCALAWKDSISVAELSAVRWAGFYEDESFRHHANHFMACHGLPAPKIVMRTNSFAALMDFVKTDDIATILTAPLAEKARSMGLRKLGLALPLWDIPVSLFYREAAKDFEPVKAFMSLASAKLGAMEWT